MKKKQIVIIDDKEILVEDIEREFERKFEEIDILGSKRDLLIGQLLCHYRPYFVEIVKVDEKYEGKLETYYSKRFGQDPSNVQRYMRVWTFWSGFALQNEAMTLDGLARHANTKLDATRRLYEVRNDAIQIIDGEIHLNPALVVDDRGTALSEFKGPEIDQKAKRIRKNLEQRIVSLHDKNINPRVQTGDSLLIEDDEAYTEIVAGDALEEDDSTAAATDAVIVDGDALEEDDSTAAATDAVIVDGGALEEDDSTAAATDAVIVDGGALEEDDSTAAATDAGVSYPRKFRGKAWSKTPVPVEFWEGGITTDNTDGKYIYRAVNCRVTGVIDAEGTNPRICVQPVNADAIACAVVWLSGQYDGTDPEFMVYTYDPRLGMAEPVRFVKES